MTASTSAPLHSMAVVVTDMLSRCILSGGFGCIAIKQSGRLNGVSERCPPDHPRPSLP